jgi:hypothetical protein
MRLGESEAANCFAACHCWQPALLLLIGSVGMNREHDETRLHRYEAAQAAIAALEFLANEAVTDTVEAGTVIAINRTTEQA